MKKKVLVKRAKVMEVDGVKRVISDFEKHYVDASKDFHTKAGSVRQEELSKAHGQKVNIGKDEFSVIDADFIDDYKHLKRTAQIIGLKDLGAIITNTGLNRDSNILEAGVGSGALTCYLASIAKKIVAYDIDERSLATARVNVSSFGFDNVEILEGDIYDSCVVKEFDFDIFILDLPEPWRAIDTAKRAVRVGGFLVIYLPHIMQVQEFVKNLPEEFLIEKTVEIIEREWVVDAQRTRPATKDHGHTAFLTFVRKIA
jgi:tRNA (adenine57-N1/adenine58-N1)-methyltransferase